MPARAACGVPPLLANPSRVSPALLQSQHGATITLTARGSCPLSQPGPPALHPLSCGGFGIPHCRGCSGFVVGLRWGQAPVQSESAAGRLGCGDALGGVTGMPCMGHGDDLYRVMGCPAWGHAPAGRQAAGRGWAVQPQPAGCAPAPHSTRMSHEERPAAGHGPARASSGAGGSSGPQGCPGCPGRRMLSHPHHCAEPLRSSVQPLLGLVAAEAVHKAAQQLVPAVPTAGKSTFPGSRAAHIHPSASQPPPAFPARATAPAQPSQQPPVPPESRIGVPAWPRVQADGGAPCRGFVCATEEGVCWQSGETLLPWVPLSQQPPSCQPQTPHSQPSGCCPHRCRGSPGCHPRGSVLGGGVATRTLSPPWGPCLLLLTAPAAPSLQPDEADGPALGLERLFVSPPPLFHGSRDQLESTSPPWGPDTGME